MSPALSLGDLEAGMQRVGDCGWPQPHEEVQTSSTHAPKHPPELTLSHLPFELLLTILSHAVALKEAPAPKACTAEQDGQQHKAEAATQSSMYARLRGVSKEWCAACDLLVTQLRINSWPCPFSISERFPNIQAVHLQHVSPSPDVTPSTTATSKARRHTRSRGPPPPTSLATAPPGPVLEAKAMLQQLTQLPHLRRLTVEQDWGGAVRGRAAHTFIAHLVSGLSSLTHLEDVSLIGNGITPCPAAYQHQAASNTDSPLRLPHLARLTITDTKLRTCPLDLSTLPNLHTLLAPGLASVRLTTNLAHLSNLDLKQCQLTEMPAAIGSMTRLTRLDLSCNQLSELPHSIGNLVQLQHFDCSDNKLTSLPSAFTSLTALECLNLSSNWQLSGAMLDTCLPPSLPHLLQLDISGVGVSALSRTFDFPNLQVLNLSCNELAEVPATVMNFRSVQNLSLDHNDLAALPEWLPAHLPTLATLDASSNRLAALPQSIGGLSASLQTLHLSSNLLTALPDSFSQLTNLADLDLQDNQLGPHLPDCLWDCTRLEYLSVAGNQLNLLPPQLLNLTLKWLDISFNELPTLPWAPTDAPTWQQQQQVVTGRQIPVVSSSSNQQPTPVVQHAPLHCMAYTTTCLPSSSTSSPAPSHSLAASGQLPQLSQLESIKMRGNQLQGGNSWWAWLTRVHAPHLVMCDLDDDESAGEDACVPGWAPPVLPGVLGGVMTGFPGAGPALTQHLTSGGSAAAGPR